MTNGPDIQAWPGCGHVPAPAVPGHALRDGGFCPVSRGSLPSGQFSITVMVIVPDPLPDPGPLVRGMDPDLDPEPSVIKQK